MDCAFFGKTKYSTYILVKPEIYYIRYLWVKLKKVAEIVEYLNY